MNRLTFLLLLVILTACNADKASTMNNEMNEDYSIEVFKIVEEMCANKGGLIDFGIVKENGQFDGQGVKGGSYVQCKNFLFLKNYNALIIKGSKNKEVAVESNNTTIAQVGHVISAIESTLKIGAVETLKALSKIKKKQEEPKSEFNQTYIASMKENIETYKKLKNASGNQLLSIEHAINKLEKTDLTNKQEKDIVGLKKKINSIKNNHNLNR